MVRRSPTADQAPHNAPQRLHDESRAINCAQRTEGQKGRMVKIRTATYVPRFRVGASSEVTASAVSSLIPAPAPAIAIPAAQRIKLENVSGRRVNCSPMKMFMWWAVEATITPMMIKLDARIATYRRPRISERDPTNGQTAAKAKRYPSAWQTFSIHLLSCWVVSALTNHVHLSAPPISLADVQCPGKYTKRR